MTRLNQFHRLLAAASAEAAANVSSEQGSASMKRWSRTDSDYPKVMRPLGVVIEALSVTACLGLWALFFMVVL